MRKANSLAILYISICLLEYVRHPFSDINAKGSRDYGIPGSLFPA